MSSKTRSRNNNFKCTLKMFDLQNHLTYPNHIRLMINNRGGLINMLSV